jgi:hypothetical protein
MERTIEDRRPPENAFDPSKWDVEPSLSLDTPGAEMPRIARRFQEVLNERLCGGQYRWRVGFARKRNPDVLNPDKGSPTDPMWKHYFVLTPAFLSQNLKGGYNKAVAEGLGVHEFEGAICWRNMILMVTREDHYLKKKQMLSNETKRAMQAPPEPDAPGAKAGHAKVTETQETVADIAPKEELIRE